MKLNFANIDNAFKMGSSNFKDTQEEIANLKKLIQSDKPKKKTQMDDSPYSITPKMNEYQPTNNFNQPMNYPNQPMNYPNQPMNQQFNSFDYNLLKVMGDPRFDHIVRNYVLINYPEWLKCSNQQQNGPQNVPSLSKSNFGNNYSSNICYEIKRYIVFFIFSVVIFLFLSLI
jgi:hypothetical protein